jgi:tetrahydromethanopterin S-methyltransferase subunit D
MLALASARRAAICSGVSGVVEAVCAEAGKTKLTASAAMSDNAASVVLPCVSNFIGSMHFVYAELLFQWLLFSETDIGGRGTGRK